MEQALEKVDSLMKEPGPQLIVTANTRNGNDGESRSAVI